MTVIDTCAWCDRLPLVPWTVTVYVPTASVLSALMVRVVVPEPPLIEEVPSDAVRPETELVVVSVIVPVNPLNGATVIVDVAAVPTLTLTLVGLAVTVKSMTVTVTVA